MSRVIDLADALVTALNTQTWTIPATAKREYRPVFDMKDMKNLRISVVPRNVEATMADRTSALHKIQIDVGLQKKLVLQDLTEIDNLMDVVQEVEDFVRSERSIGSGAWTETSNSPIFSQEHMADYRQFTSVLTFSFRLMGVS